VRVRARRWAFVIPAALLLLPVVAGCGDSGGGATQAFGARTSSAVSLSATLTIGGTYSITATWTDDISDATTAPTCQAAANGFYQDGLRYALPRSPLTTSFDGHVVGIVAGISGYHGPTGYDAPAVSGADGTPNIITVDGAGWAAVNGGTAHVDVKPDNSGQLVFQKLAPTPPTPAPTVSGQPAATPPAARAGSITGTLAWTCTTLRPPSPSATASPASAAASPATPALSSPKPGAPTPTLPH
jgi:hypothetical protein